MTNTIRIAALVISTALSVANLTSVASAQAFTAGWGTGNVDAAHYDAVGHLFREQAPQTLTTPFDQGLSAFAQAPAPVRRRQVR